MKKLIFFAAILVLSNYVYAGIFDTKLTIHNCIGLRESRRCIDNADCSATSYRYEFNVNEKNQNVMVTESTQNSNKEDASYLLKDCNFVDEKNWECAYKNKIKDEVFTMAKGRVYVRTMYFGRIEKFACAK
jgi:archaellum component FlaF (FlaF/FlaG flagellin family)